MIPLAVLIIILLGAAVGLWLMSKITGFLSMICLLLVIAAGIAYLILGFR